MATYIVVIDGPLKGEKFEVKGGESIGRDRGDIILNDSKVSSLHAIVKKSLLGQLSLVDHKSKNGVIVEGNRVDKFKLSDGVEFRIGSHLFRVEVVREGTESKISDLPPASEQEESSESISLPPTPEEPINERSATFEEFSDIQFDPAQIKDGETFVYEPEESDPKPILDEDSFRLEPSVNTSANLDILDKVEMLEPESDKIVDLDKDNISSLSLKDLTAGNEKIDSKLSFRTLEPGEDEAAKGLFEEPKQKTWSRVLEVFSRKNIRNAADELKDVIPLSPRVKLTFFRGMQAETEWELGYGPRIVGKNSIDLPIWEPSAPPNDCFQISQDTDGPQFSTNHPDVVKINGKSIKQVTLRTGDTISIAETEIEVELF